MTMKNFFECQIAVNVLINYFPHTKLGPTYSGNVGRNNEFNLLSLNVRGIRTFEKRKAVFSWLVNSDADIIFLQETYSTRDILKISGENNGKVKCSSRMAAIIAEQRCSSTDKG